MCTDTKRPKNWAQKIWMIRMVNQTITNEGLVVTPSKMFIWSLIFLEQIMLKICMNTNRLKMMDR